MRSRPIAVAGMIEPQVAAIDRPGVDHVCVRKERRVERVVGVMVREQNVGNALRGNAEAGQVLDHLVTVGDHSRIYNQAGVAIENERDARGHVVAVDRPRVDDVKRGAIVHLRGKRSVRDVHGTRLADAETATGEERGT